MDKRIEFSYLFTGFQADPVEPKNINWITGNQFLDLLVGVIRKVIVMPSFHGIGVLVLGVIPEIALLVTPIAGGIRMMPVAIDRIIDPELQSCLLAGSSQFGHRVAVKASHIDNIILAHLRVVHRKSVMMLSHHNHVFHAGIFSNPHPLVRVKIHGIKLPYERVVFNIWNAAKLEPLRISALINAFPVTPGLRIGTPGDHHAKSGIEKPFYALFFGNFCISSCLTIQFSGSGKNDCQKYGNCNDLFFHIFSPISSRVLPLVSGKYLQTTITCTTIISEKKVKA